MKEAEATARALNHTDTAEKLEDDPRLVLKNIKLLGGDSTDLDLILQEGDELACPNIKEDIQVAAVFKFRRSFYVNSLPISLHFATKLLLTTTRWRKAMLKMVRIARKLR